MKIERYLSQKDAAILSRLAEHLLRLRDVNINFAEQLIDLIGTSMLLPDNVERDDCVALYSTVTYRDLASNQQKSVFIVCPQDAHDGLAQVSILAPLAMSLLGRTVGSIVEVTLPFHQTMFVEIVRIEPVNGIAHVPGDRMHASASAPLAAQS